MARWAMVREVENPSAPALIASRTISRMASMSAGVAGSFLAPRSPMTYVRTAPWATWAPTSTVHLRRARASRYSGNDSHCQSIPSASAVPGMSSTPSISPMSQFPPCGAHRRETNAAVAHDHSGDAVQRGWCKQIVPGGLAVIVGVDVDPSRRHQESGGIEDRAPGVREIRPDSSDAVALNCDVSSDGRRPGAVDDRPVSDQQIGHAYSLSTPAWGGDFVPEPGTLGSKTDPVFVSLKVTSTPWR